MAVRTFAIIEDEPPARAMLQTLLKDLAPEATCLGEAEDGVAGLALLRRTAPDVLFLDIEFPPDGAFGLLRQARAEGLHLPPIVFVTAYDHHAVQAFRWAACDYLLKPVEPAQLREALARVKPAFDPARLFEALARPAAAPERFTVRVKGRLRVMQWKEVRAVITENRLAFAHTAEGRFVLDQGLDELESLLAPTFLRTHRSALVNLDAVRELLPDPGHTSTLVLLDGLKAPVSRDRLAEVRRALG